MNMYQDLEPIKDKIIKMYTKNPNRSISSTLRTLSSFHSYSGIGEYPILSRIISTVIEMGIRPSRFQVTYALNQLDEMSTTSKKEKTELLSDLLYPLYFQSNTTKKPLRSTLNPKDE